MYTKVSLCHASSEQDQMVKGVCLIRVRHPGKTSLWWRWGELLQIQHFILSVQQTLDKPAASKIETILRQSDKPLKLISKLYQGLIEALPDDTKHVIQYCEENLGDTFDDDEWIQICLNAESCSYNHKHKLLQFKTLHRTYYVPVNMNIMHSEMLFHCWRCKTQKGDPFAYVMLLWRLAEFWQRVCSFISAYLQIHPSPCFCLLGNVDTEDSYQKKLCNLALPLIGRLVILPQRHNEWQKCQVMYH